MKILSLFDGISCARVALDRAGIKVNNYYSSEIDRFALSISAKNYPDIVQLGSVVNLGKEIPYPKELLNGGCDLIVFGSPCTDLSIAKKNRQGLKGEASGLFYEAVRIMKDLKPRYFLMENVASMSKENKEIILKTIQEIDPSAYVIMINAALVSAQNRKRLFFTNIPNVTLPEDRGILLKDILENGDSDRLKSYCIDANYAKGASWKQYIEKGRRQLVIQKDGSEKLKSNTVRTSGRGSGIDDKHNWDTIRIGQISEGQKMGQPTSSQNKPQTTYDIRKLTCVECERLQGVPDNYTEGVSNTQRYKMLGNAFNVDVVAHILASLTKPKE